jgi:predicted nucleotidyltransferase component of viral defense system
VSDPVTTAELLDAAEERTGLLREQLLLMVAKSATVRHVATSAQDGRLLVLKGGTLLTHVYRSPRQSIADADYLHLEPETVNAPEIERALTVRESGFSMDTHLSFRDNKFEGKGEFSFDDISLGLSRRRIRRPRQLKITVSVRPGERLDEPTEPLIYHDPTLYGRNRFEVEGLTLNELAAEKILGWCSKDLPKHLVDLAYIAREWNGEDQISHELVADLVSRKFATEGKQGRYRSLRVSRPCDLVPRFADPYRLKKLLHDGWGDLAEGELFFLPGERAESGEMALTESANIERLAMDFWEPTLSRL